MGPCRSLVFAGCVPGLLFLLCCVISSLVTNTVQSNSPPICCVCIDLRVISRPAPFGGSGAISPKNDLRIASDFITIVTWKSSKGII